MADYTMTAKELILTSGSSRGSQIKFFRDNHWYKIDEQGPEGKAEELSSKILDWSDFSKDEFVKYESCTIEYNGKTYNGCKSENFLKSGEQLLSYEKIYKLMNGKSLTETISLMESPKERIEFVARVVDKFCGLDVYNHIAKNLTASMILMDTDRHLNNIAIIADANLSNFRNAPIFDNGAAFLSNYTAYPKTIDVSEIKNNEISIIGKPFAANLEYQAVEAGLSIKFNFNKIHSILNKEPDVRIKDIVNFAISKYEQVQDLQFSSSVKHISKIMEIEWEEYFSKADNEKSGKIMDFIKKQ